MPKAPAMIGLGDFSRVVTAIHAAAVTPDHWIEAMAAARDALGGISGAMIVIDGTTRVIKSASIPPEAHRTYVDYYRRIDYVLDAVERGPVGLIHGGEALIALNARSEFNADWMRPHHMDDGLFVRLTRGSEPTCFLVAAPKGRETFATTARVDLVNALVPHLQQALRTQDHLTGLKHQADDVAEAVDGVRHGVIVVGPESVVIHLNRVAEDMLAVGDGLVVRSGTLGLRVHSADTALHRSIVGALGAGDPPAYRGDSLCCPRADGRRPYVVHVVPFASGTPGGREQRALVLIVDPERQCEPPKELLSRLYGLTNAEAEVALRATRGQGLRPIAEELSLSTATVKTHLQRVFLKTETHRQAELVRLLVTIMP